MIKGEVFRLRFCWYIPGRRERRVLGQGRDLNRGRLGGDEKGEGVAVTGVELLRSVQG